jgi:cell division initiation protein
MKISPIEIRQKDFEKAFRGYEKEEVDAFLLSVSQEWERVMEENKEIRRKFEHAEKEVSRLREVENSLFKTLKTAEDTGAHMIDHANKTADLHLREAQMKAESMMNEARSKARAMMEEAEEKTKDVIGEMQDQAKALQKEYSYILNERDNLLQDLKNLVNDTLEKVNRTISKNQGFEEKMKAIKNIGFERKTINPETVLKEFTQDTPSSQANEEQRKDSNGNFFDAI